MPRKETPDVRAVLKEYRPDLRAVANELRTLVREAAPDARETVKWGNIVFQRDGDLCYLSPATNHITFGFFQGARLGDPDRLLGGMGKAMRHVKVRPGTIRKQAFQALVRQAVSLDRS